MERPLIVASNRLPFVVKKDETSGELKRINSAGGLVTALAPLVAKTNGFWIGWAGCELTEDQLIPESTDPSSITHEIKSRQIVPIFYTDEIYHQFYNGMCNASFWPLLHSLPTMTVFKSSYWNAYVEVNNNFAAAAFDTLKKIEVASPRSRSSKNSIAESGPITNGSSPSKTPLIWIHDYHLMVMPLALKNLIEDATSTGQLSLIPRLAFFLHIPFPSWDVFRLNPWSHEVLLGLLGCDLIAFHTNTYAFNFLECCFQVLGARIDKSEMLVDYGNRTIAVRALPIGIPYNWFENMARQAPKTLNFKERVILGVDRLDYTKGIIQRMNGYERFLEKYPECLEKVVLLQVAVPSRIEVEDYRNLKDELEREIGRICGRFATNEWTPIKYIYKNIPQSELCGYYRDAGIALITPVRDGMNLVAKEYVACQLDNPGVLIISPFTGAGETMNEAVLVNPLETDMLADAIKHACDMKYQERKLRMNALQTRERLFNLDTWLESFLEACDLVDSIANRMQSLNVGDYESWIGPIIKGYKLTIILDYDGTLVPLAPHPDLAVLPDDVKELLQKLIQCKEIDFCVLSGRSLADLKKMIPLEGINLAGSHGMELQLGSQVPEECCEQASIFRAKVADLVQELRESVCVHGGWIEEKTFHVTFHWRETNNNYRTIMVHKAKEIMQKHGFQALNGHFSVEARPPIGWDKGRGALYILEKLNGVTWANDIKAVFIGDDETDEDAMRALSGLGITFRVGKPNIKTAASHRLPNPAAVKTFLEWALESVETRSRNTRRNQGLVRRDRSV